MNPEKINNIEDRGKMKKSSNNFLKALYMTLVIGVCFNQYGYSQANGDTYKTAIGVKFYPTGVTLKTFVK
ncbi:MAG: hypothetical protein IPL55_18785 [Saprospiraceae bacterium]|jgi:hypothetical protein|nr:hypothetical protein [Saprospiraceae bacterium]